jgi:2-polyprenyl-3-methyl-5-hydroxy-6-metoxy-1,4-benzoquinol methylase
MKLAPDALPYVDGSQFSTSLAAKLAGENTRARSRLDFIEDAARGKQVLHIGFADHQESIEAKIPHDLWLHGRLARVAARCLGVDINADAVAYCRDTVGVGDVHVHNIIADPPLAEIMATHWDVAVLGEILEHVPNPAAFLEALGKKYGGRIGRLIVTVPNAFFLDNFTAARRNVENINTDHRYWFTPFTLAKIAHDAGWTLDSFHYVDSPWPGGIKGMIRRRYPMLRETLIGELTP